MQNYQPAKSPPKRDTLTISQLNRQAKRLLEGHFASVWVAGEISNLSQPSSGHWYFSLKDSGAQVRCAMFRSSNARLRFKVEAGQQVLARAKLSLYEPRGDYQLIVEHLEPAGEGALALAFEQLKAKLQQQGWFDASYKKAIPSLPRHIAVITSPTGAAIRDILTVLGRRFAGIQVTVLPVAVQGQGAAAEIAKAINTANEQAEVLGFDVILAGRGGGSIEDLWAFNEEVVAQAIFHSQLPVVSAVGHETDFTIADFVADIRAATPSAAAELLSPNSIEMMASFNGYEQLLRRNIQQTLTDKRQKLDWLQSHIRHPGSRLQEHSQRLDELELRLLNGWRNHSQQTQMGIDLLKSRLQQQTPRHLIRQLQQTASNLLQRLEKNSQHALLKKQQRLASAIHLLETVSPLATLKRGYAITTDTAGKVVRQADEVIIGQTLLTKLANGNVESTVTATNPAPSPQIIQAKSNKLEGHMDLQLYPLIKLLHMATATFTISCFIYRGSLKLIRENYKPTGWLRYAPHLNDTVLFSCAIFLAWQSHQYPFSTDWVTAKLVALLLYIGLGMVVLRFGRNRQQRGAAFVMALLCFGYIVAVAINRTPLPGF